MCPQGKRVLRSRPGAPEIGAKLRLRPLHSSRCAACPLQGLVAVSPRFAPSTQALRPRALDRPIRCRSSVVEHSLGKGEVLSSILSGSTTEKRGASECCIWIPFRRSFWDFRNMLGMCQERGAYAGTILTPQPTTAPQSDQLPCRDAADSHRQGSKPAQQRIIAANPDLDERRSITR